MSTRVLYPSAVSSVSNPFLPLSILSPGAGNVIDTLGQQTSADVEQYIGTPCGNGRNWVHGGIAEYDRYVHGRIFCLEGGELASQRQVHMLKITKTMRHECTTVYSVFRTLCVLVRVQWMITMADCVWPGHKSSNFIN